MSLTTYAELKSAIANWLMRDDLTDVIGDFVKLAEVDMLQKLRLRSMLTRATATIGTDGYEELPADFLEMWRVTLDGEPLTFAPTALMAGYQLDWTGGPPLYYSLIGGQIQLAPAPASTATGELELVYYAQVEGLSDDNPSNILLAASPGMYLYGALTHASPYLGDDARAQTWATLYAASIDRLQNADMAAEISGPLVVQTGAWS